jgi:hypothetical protein
VSKTFALVIGIDDYSHFDPTGRNDLRGAVNDAHRWQGFLTGRLGVPADQLRLLTSGDATRDAIRAGVAWLVEQLQTAGPDAAGLVTFSGHGAGAADTAQARLGLTDCLCPADVEVTADGLLDHTISFANLQHWLQAHDDAAADPRERLSSRVTVILDACYGVQTQGPRVRSMGATAGADGEQRASEVTSRLLLGCQPWSESYELVAHERYHGAFTWCLLTLLERWTTRTEAGQTFVNVAYVDLVHRVRSMLDVLGVPQAPWMLGPPYASLLPFLRGAAELTGDATSTTPDEPLPGSQIESPLGTQNIRITTITGTWAGPVTGTVAICAEVLSSQTVNGYALVGGLENWIFYPQALSSRTMATLTGLSVSITSPAIPTPPPVTTPPTPWVIVLPAGGTGPVQMMSRCYWTPSTPKSGGGYQSPFVAPTNVAMSPSFGGVDPSNSPSLVALALGGGSDGMKAPNGLLWQKNDLTQPYILAGTTCTPTLALTTTILASGWAGWAGGAGPALQTPTDGTSLAYTGTKAPWGLGYTFRYTTAWLNNNVESNLSPVVQFQNSLQNYWGTILRLESPPLTPPVFGSGTTQVVVYRQILNGAAVIQDWTRQTFTQAPPPNWVDTLGV